MATRFGISLIGSVVGHSNRLESVSPKRLPLFCCDNPTRRHKLHKTYLTLTFPIRVEGVANNHNHDRLVAFATIANHIATAAAATTTITTITTIAELVFYNESQTIVNSTRITNSPYGVNVGKFDDPRPSVEGKQSCVCGPDCIRVLSRLGSHASGLSHPLFPKSVRVRIAILPTGGTHRAVRVGCSTIARGCQGGDMSHPTNDKYHGFDSIPCIPQRQHVAIRHSARI